MGGSVLSSSNELDLVERARTAKKLWCVLEEIFGRLEIDFYIYLVRRRDGRLYHRTNLPADAYGGAEHDPFLKYCCQNMGETFVGIDYDARYPFLSPEEDAFIAKAASGGWRAGVAIPVMLRQGSECGGFNLGSRRAGRDFEALVRPHLDRLRAICLLAQRKVEQFEYAEVQGSRVVLDEVASLTARQREVLVLLRQGCGRDSIAERLGISVQTAATHQKAIYRKLGVHSQRELMSPRGAG